MMFHWTALILQSFSSQRSTEKPLQRKANFGVSGLVGRGLFPDGRCCTCFMHRVASSSFRCSPSYLLTNQDTEAEVVTKCEIQEALCINSFLGVLPNSLTRIGWLSCEQFGWKSNLSSDWLYSTVLHVVPPTANYILCRRWRSLGGHVSLPSLRVSVGVRKLITCSCREAVLMPHWSCSFSSIVSKVSPPFDPLFDTWLLWFIPQGTASSSLPTAVSYQSPPLPPHSCGIASPPSLLPCLLSPVLGAASMSRSVLPPPPISCAPHHTTPSSPTSPLSLSPCK